NTVSIVIARGELLGFAGFLIRHTGCKKLLHGPPGDGMMASQGTVAQTSTCIVQMREIKAVDSLLVHHGQQAIEINCIFLSKGKAQAHFQLLLTAESQAMQGGRISSFLTTNSVMPSL